jgi:Dockerin type I domain
MASNYTVTPVKDDNPLNGVTTFDLLLISKHILDILPIASPYKMIAADVNKSGSITTYDIVELRKLILGIYNELPNNTSWRFVDKEYIFPVANNPFTVPFPEFKTVADIQQNEMNEDFVAVKIGDINGNATANNLMASDDRNNGTLLFDLEDRLVKAGETFTVRFSAAERVLGYQFTMNFKGLEVMSILPGTRMSEGNFAIFNADNALTTSFDENVQAEFSVTFKAKADGKLSELLTVGSRITKAEAYNAAAKKYDVAFRFNTKTGSTISEMGFELYQNQPNPFVTKTVIGFHLPIATEATLTVYDEMGKVLTTQQGDFAKGDNVFVLDANSIKSTGVLYYKVETSAGNATMKMISVK